VRLRRINQTTQARWNVTDALVAEGLTRSVELPTGERLPLLQDLDLRLAPGKTVAIMGRSGSGKSTLLSILGLLTNPDGGELSIGGELTDALTDRERARIRNERIGFVFQSYSLVAHMTAWENVELPLIQGQRMRRRERQRRVRQAMELARIAHRATSRPKQLSGGEQQRTAIARALVRSPDLILADEPTGALDTISADHVLDVLTEAAIAHGAALIIATHDEVVAARTGDIRQLEDGQLRELAAA
jgi:ABC-type lipoprotein export system ATPase subunit